MERIQSTQKQLENYGGGESGLMGTVAKEVYEADCEMIGVVPGNVDFIKDRPQPYVTELITTNNMSDRKEKMLELADAFLLFQVVLGHWMKYLKLLH